MGDFEVTSIVHGPAEAVWERACTPEGINDELTPLVRMTVPAAFKGRSLADVMPGEKLGRSWILAVGLVPIDYDDIGIAEIGPGCRFLEESTMLSMRTWRHERTVTPVDDGRCEVTDRIGFEPRALMRPASPLLARVFRQVFKHRHRRLARFWVP